MKEDKEEEEDKEEWKTRKEEGGGGEEENIQWRLGKIRPELEALKSDAVKTWGINREE